MFTERFDALMRIAEVSNSMMGRAINMNPSHIGRLRSGARPLSKRHEYLPDMCRYLAGHMKKDYQITAMQQLTNISSSALSSPESIASYLEQWLLKQSSVSSAASKRLNSGFPLSPLSDSKSIGTSQKFASHLYGNAGKRKAVEQFFMTILQEEEPQTLLLFSDENMAWLYEDSSFAARWMELFKMVIQKGNRVKIIHTISRNLNEMMEAVTKWIPIYMTGMIEPYCYPHLRDGLFQRTLFIAPNTAAVVSSSVQHNTDDMLNVFLTDRAALNALTTEYERLFSLCRPLIHIYTEKDKEAFYQNAENLFLSDGDIYIYCKMPPLFTMPEELVYELSSKTGDDSLPMQWNQSLARFRKSVQKEHITLALLSPDAEVLTQSSLLPLSDDLFSDHNFTYTKEQYLMHIDYLQQLEGQYDNLSICFVNGSVENATLYVKEDKGAILAGQGPSKTAFITNESIMVAAFRDFIEKYILI